MIKKLTAYSFVLIANLVFLAHAVLPHHHHDQIVCIASAHCVGDQEAHIHNNSAQNHQHDGNKNSTGCILKQAVVILPSQVRFLNNCYNCSDNHNKDYFIHSNFEFEDLQTVSVNVASVPEFDSILISFVTTSPGLRAPPLV